jgi:hypothetical protein
MQSQIPSKERKKSRQMYSQTRVEAAIFGTARTSERRLGHSVVLGVEVVDNLVSGFCELRCDGQQWKSVDYGEENSQLPLAQK